MFENDRERVFDFWESLTEDEIRIIKSAKNPQDIKRMVMDIQSDLHDTAKALEIEG